MTADDRFTAHLPYGEPLPTPQKSIVAWPNWPFNADGTVKPLERPVIPEPARKGVGGVDCHACDRPDDDFLWVDEDWRLSAFDSPGVPLLMLYPRRHCDFTDLGPRLLAAFGPIVHRVEAALLGLGGIARVQFDRWGDGGEHFHLWFHARPLGMTQLRGTALSTWDDVLPRLPEDVWRDARAEIAAAMAADGGTGRG
ncbi:hypothetical protein [Stackebrandtia soli]|uniref:hypothetical protein n=1 Tax=Stackebrandtia soli TaxID=1892856 RepID=UPI0039E96884